ncbi:hypothetical protein [Bradyrhizobium valentinum]|uniref:Uncharacterized protein n=1 Tax=Bradyrhizobium valentinum TaxID=1518501 RepID=A0A0R3LHQ3_9BRAD|nr:hypothetical protein [Bradyrhizobium valentinum]KRR04608.1 hypothetical protein CP49_11320 [Bradyrhizobium valentinum]
MRAAFPAPERGPLTQNFLELDLSFDFASPAQLGGTVAFLCSAAADQIMGTATSVDGGWTAR